MICEWLDGLVRCDACGCRVRVGEGGLRCEGCGRLFPEREGFFDVLGASTAPSGIQVEYHESFPKKLNAKNFEHYAGRRWAALRPFIPETQDGRSISLLEIGCGEGNFLRYLAGVSNARLVGVEPSALMCARASRTCAGAAVFRAYGEKIPLAAGTFDIVYENAVLHHARDIGKFFGEAFRVCRPGGAVILVEPQRWHPLMVLYALAERTERPLLGISRRMLMNMLAASTSDVAEIPLNTFIYSYRSFPPRGLLPLMARVERQLDSPLLASHFMLVARKSE